MRFVYKKYHSGFRKKVSWGVMYKECIAVTETM